MRFESIIWDLDDDPGGNVQHCAEHDISKEEVEEALSNATDGDISRSSGRPVIFGDTNAGRHLMIAFEIVWFIVTSRYFQKNTIAMFQVVTKVN